MTVTFTPTPTYRAMKTIIDATDEWWKNLDVMTYEDLNLILNAAYHVLEAIPTVTADANLERRIQEATELVDDLSFTTYTIVEDHGKGDKIAGKA